MASDKKYTKSIKRKKREGEREKDVLQDNKPTQVGSKNANDRCLEAAQLKDQLR